MQRGSLPLGIALTQAVWLRPSLLLIALAPIAVLCLHCGRSRATRRVASACGAMVFAGCLVCGDGAASGSQLRSLSALSDGLLRTVEGTIIDAAPLRSERVENVEETPSEEPTQRIDLRVA